MLAREKCELRPNLSPATVPAGTRISSFYVHFDAVGIPEPANAIPLAGSLTFDTNVVGLIVLDSALLDSAAYPGLASTVYASSVNFGLEIFADGTGFSTRDGITLSADRRTVSLDLRDGAAPDNVRIITAAAAVPEPSAAGLAILAMSLFAMRRLLWRRRSC